MSPSQVARYYFHECDRYLRYRAATPAQREADGIPAFAPDRSLLTRAILEGGAAWEERLLADHLAGRVSVCPGDGRVSDRRFSVEATLDWLAHARAGGAIFQPTLRAPGAFYARYGLDPDFVALTDCHPDLLMVEETDQGIELRVVDAKASEMMKLSHRIQVGLYSLLLDAVVHDAGLDGALGVSRTGGVWLYEQPRPEWFELARIRGQLEMFLAHDLTEILTAPADGAFWHLYFRCEWCDYFDHCHAEAHASNDVSLVPYLSTFAKRHLASRAAVRSVADLGALLDQPDVEAVLAGCASLEGRSRQLRLTVDALTQGRPQPRGAAAVGMPKGEHVLLVLTVQSEPLEGRVYAYGLYRAKSRDLFGDGTTTIARVAPSGSADALRDLRRHLVRDLIGVLRTVDAHNRAHAGDWRAQKTLQAYVFDTYERDLLVQTLLGAVLDDDVAEDAVALLFHFQHPDLVLADDHPATEVFFPLVVLTDVIRGLMALPIPVVYRFADVVRELQPSSHGFDYSPSDFFAFRLSNRMKSNAILEVWERGRVDLVAAIERELRARVWAANSVISGLRERLEPQGALFAWPPKFALPAGFGFTDRILSRLAFIARYETVLEYLDVRSRRAAPREDRLAAGTTIELTHVGGARFRADPEAIERARLEPSGFASFVLTPDTDAGRRARLAYDDFAFRDRMHAPSRLDLALAGVSRIDGDEVTLTLTPSAVFTAPQPGAVYALDPRLTDWNSKRVVAELAALDDAGDGAYTRLLLDPLGARRRTDVAPAVREHALALAEAHGMTASQLAAFAGMVDHDVQVVWGPPGTGKTHFLALALLCLAEAHRAAGLPLRAALTAFTHAAIDHLLGKVSALQAAGRVFGGDLPVYRIDRGGGPRTVTGDSLPGLFQRYPHVVAGGTVWQLWRADPAEVRADVVVIDEGSQLEVGPAAIPFRRRAAGGRLVVAGDPDQLPPIVAGDYPSGDGEPPLARSILECLRHHDPAADRGLVAPLLENFRMNDVLCEYPAASIYPPDYRPATEQIAGARLDLALPDGDGPADAFVRAALDPGFPLVVCVLENVQATRENADEARLVASLARHLRAAHRGDDDEFWRERLFIVCPHHAQIRLTRAELARRLRSPHSFVDTVDKMQGQERDTVIVSYGVSDVEYALGEKEFIYSRNRLNVAITRARMKTVVLISRRLLDPPIQALEGDEVADGIAYMQGLAFHCEERSDPVRLRVGSVDLTVLRA